MVDRTTTDHAEKFQGALELNLLYWKKFFELDHDQRAGAERRLQQGGHISPDRTDNYEVIVGRAGIHEGSPLPQIGNNSAYFTAKNGAQSLVDYLTSDKRFTARIEEH